MRRLIAIVLVTMLAAACLALFSCSDNKTNSPTTELNSILLQPQRLPTLKSGLIYEGWVVNLDADSNWASQQSFGKFFWDEFNYFFLSPSDTTKRIDSVFTINGNVYDYDAIAITLENFPVDESPDPSPAVVAYSVLDPNRYTTMEFPVSFGEATGYYVIGTFSDGNNVELEQDIRNEESGIWFIELLLSEQVPNPADTTKLLVNEEYGPGLKLPVLPDTGFLYEGWVELSNGDTISTGKFYLPGFQDYDNEHCTYGAIPNFPGEDFLLNPPAGVTDFPPDLLNGGKAVITLEPNPDNDLARPSNFVVLEKELITSELRVRTQSEPMSNVAVLSFPKVNVSFSSR